MAMRLTDKQPDRLAERVPDTPVSPRRLPPALFRASSRLILSWKCLGLIECIAFMTNPFCCQPPLDRGTHDQLVPELSPPVHPLREIGDALPGLSAPGLLDHPAQTGSGIASTPPLALSSRLILPRRSFRPRRAGPRRRSPCPRARCSRLPRSPLQSRPSSPSTAG